MLRAAEKSSRGSHTWIYDRKPDDGRYVLVTGIVYGSRSVITCASWSAPLGRWITDRIGVAAPDEIIAWAELPPCAQRQGE